MKTHLFCITLILLLFSCGKKAPQQIKETPQVLSVTILIYDISISTDLFAMLHPEHLNSIYHKIGSGGGGKFYALHIKANSLQQDPYMQNIPRLNLLEIKGNVYQQQNRMNENRDSVAKFENKATAFIDSSANNIILPKTEKFSDIEHALQLANSILSMPEYKNYKKQIICISDMENDLPPYNGIDKMKPVKFLSDVKIAIVRKSAAVSIDEMIVGGRYTLYTTIPDAINSLCQ